MRFKVISECALEAVQQLIHLTESPHEGVVRQAKNALKGLIGDDSRKVAKAAARALERRLLPIGFLLLQYRKRHHRKSKKTGELRRKNTLS